MGGTSLDGCEALKGISREESSSVDREAGT